MRINDDNTIKVAMTKEPIEKDLESYLGKEGYILICA